MQSGMTSDSVSRFLHLTQNVYLPIFVLLPPHPLYGPGLQNQSVETVGVGSVPARL